jgi:hypothetical protein
MPAGRARSGQAAADETPAVVAKDAELTASVQSEALTKVGFSDWGQGQTDWAQDSYGDRDNGGGSTGAPWDMAGEWGSASRTGPSDAWSADPLGSATSPERAGQRDNPSRQTGQQSSLPRSPVPDSRPPQSPVLGTPVPEIRAPESRAPESRAPESRAPESRAPWETGPQRPPWESGPQAPVTATGPQSASARTGSQPVPRAGTGPQPSSWADSPSSARTGSQPVPRAGTGPQPLPWADPQPSSWADPQPSPRTGPQPSPWADPPSSWADPQPSSRTDPQPSSRTGAQPSSRTGAQPVSPATEPSAAPTGTRPVSMAPWESGDWGKAPDWDAIGGHHDVPSAPAPGAGSGAWPVTGRPKAPAKTEKVEKTEKPERHSHRAAKHGRPSRWRGSGNRSTGDGES